MDTGTSLWMRSVGQDGRVFAWTPHQCPSDSQLILGKVGIPLALIQTVGTVGIWYELHKSRKLQEQTFKLSEAQFEERRHDWIKMALMTWIETHSKNLGLDFAVSLTVKKELIKFLIAYTQNKKVDIPEVLLLSAHNIQHYISSRVELAYKITNAYRQYSYDLSKKGDIAHSKLYDNKIWYIPGNRKTDKFLQTKAQDEIEKIEQELNETGFFDTIFGSRPKELENRKKWLIRQHEITKKCKPFQNLIHEINNILFVHKKYQEIKKRLPSNLQKEFFIRPELKKRWMISNKIIVDNKKNLQKFEIIGVDKNLLN